jgi:hypothetical protein
MSNYIDNYGRYHDKPVTDSNPTPSNNGWIYTAYADKLGLPVDKQKLTQCFSQCKRTDKKGRTYLIRSPLKESPPISRDEILGMAELGLLQPKHLNGWNFSPYPLPVFSLLLLIKQLWEIKDKHRNYFWQNGLSMVYHLAFSVPLSDRHFILSKWGKFNLFYFLVAKVDSLLPAKNGIKWLKNGGDKKALLSEFPDDHPFKSSQT